MQSSQHRARTVGDVYTEMQEMVDNITEGILKQHNSSLDVLDDIMAAFSNCDVEKAKNDQDLQTSAATIGSKTSEHETCRGQEKDAAIAKGQCDDALAALNDAKDTLCAALDQLTKDPNTEADVCHSAGPEDYESWVKRNREYFIKTADDFDKVKNKCTAAVEKVEVKGPKCTGFSQAHTVKRSACDGLQHELETASCSYGTLLASSCGGYTDCWDAAEKAYDKTTSELKEQAESRKAEWRAAMRIQCLVETFNTGGQDAAIDECIKKVHNTSLLDIDIHPAPAKSTCASPIPLPCSGDYANTHYSSLPKEAPAATCTPCMVSRRAASDWVTVLKVGPDSTLGYSSPLWQNDALLEEHSSADTPGNAKYASYLNTPFKSIRMCIGAPNSNCVEHTFAKEWASAKALFSAGYIRDPSLDRDGILGAFAVTTGAYQDCPMQRPGFNIECNDGNWARFGFCLNCASQPCQNDDINDADASIGIGLHGQSTGSEMGAGWTQYFASGAGTCDPNSMTYKNAWLAVKATSGAAASVKDDSWSLIMKVASDSTLGYSSPYWQDDALLNADSPAGVTGVNAKYAYFLNKPFTSIRMCIGTPDSNCVEHTFAKEWASAKALFSAGYIRDPSLDRDGILGAFAVTTGAYQDCPMQRPGFNIQCNDGNWARFGFCLNCASQPCQNDDGHDADASIGIGLHGQSTGSEMGAGWTQYFASGAGTCDPNSMTYKNAWLWVK